jgi:hypothetical protein
MKPSVYLETTIPSYLTARASRDLIFMANQQVTRDWWDSQRTRFDLFISQFVLDEAGGGDADAAMRRLELVRGLPLLEAGDECLLLARDFSVEIPLPQRAATDALHLAVAALHGMDYLLTWNCTHLANAALRSRIESVCESANLAPPIICTPPELMLE